MKVIITGASGLLGAVMEYMLEKKPDLIINCAGFRMVDAAEEQRRMTYAINTFGAKNAALAASKLDIPLIHISSDSVFDGETEVPYHEYDKTNPINTYGRSKLMEPTILPIPALRPDIIFTAPARPDWDIL